MTRELFGRAIDTGRAVGGDEMAEILAGNLGTLAMQQGDLDAAESFFGTALAGLGHQRPTRDSVIVVLNLAELARLRGDTDLAAENASKALEMVATLEDESVADLKSPLHTMLGSIAQQRGDLDHARASDHAALETAELAAESSVPYLRYCLATLAIGNGDNVAAARELTQALRMALELDARADIAESLDATARLLVQNGNPTIGARLLAAADAIRESVELPRPPADQTLYEEIRAAAESARGTAFDADWAVGCSWTVEQAVGAALNALAVVGKHRADATSAPLMAPDEAS